MSFNRIKAQLQNRGDGLSRLAFSKQLQDLALPGSEELIAILDFPFAHLPHIIFYQHLPNARTEESLPLADVLDRIDQIVFRRILQQIRLGSGLQGLQHISFVSMHAEKYNRRPWQSIGNLPGSLDTI